MDIVPSSLVPLLSSICYAVYHSTTFIPHNNNNNVEEAQSQKHENIRKLVNTILLLFKIINNHNHNNNNKNIYIYFILSLSSTLLKSICEIRIIPLITNIEENIITNNTGSIMDNIKRLLYLFVPSSLFNSSTIYFSSILTLELRKLITNYFLNKYFTNKSYYNINNNVGTDSSIMSISNLLSADIDDFSKSIVTTFFHIINPVIDTFIIIQKIQNNYSMEGVYYMLLYYVSVSFFMSYIRQPTISFNSKEQSLEGEYHDILNQINIFSEQIASYNNNNNNNTYYYEYNLLNLKFTNIIDYLFKFARYRLCVNYLDNLFPW